MMVLPTLAFWLAACGSPSAQDPAELEATVVELLLGEKGRIYSPSRPDYGKLLALGDRVLPLVLKHAGDRPEAPAAAATVLFHFAYQRFALSKEARDWLLAELGRGNSEHVLVAAVGLLGEEATLPALEKLAAREDDRGACTAVQAIGAVGSPKAQASLERLQSTAPSAEARNQCKTILESLYYPFLGEQGDARMVLAFETSKDRSLKYAIPGGWFAAGERILRRWIRDRRADLAPQLRQVADRQVAANPGVVDNPTDVYLRALLGIRLLGGALTEAEVKRLIDSHAIEAPAK